MHVDPARSRTLVQAARVAPSLERLVGTDHADADRRLRSLPGIGVWTSAETRVRAMGDPDAVSFGDYHIAKDVGWALTGTPVDDEGLAELLRAVASAPAPGAGAGRDHGAAPPPARPADVAADAPAGELTRPGAQSSGRSGASTASVKRR